MRDEANGELIHKAVRERYGAAARRLQETAPASCCSRPGCCSNPAQLYALDELGQVPEAAALASMGCGNPLLLAELKPGETVLDLGSGGGIDVLLSARRVGPTGKAYGLDMTDEMLELARANARQAGATNVEFLKGQIESIPLPDASVDVIISNCVINLSPDKRAVLAEAYRILRPGGRLAVADIVVQGRPLPTRLRQALSLWTDCVSGAITEDRYRQDLAAAGFVDADVQVLKEYGPGDLLAEFDCCGQAGLTLPRGSKIVSAFITARRPEGQPPA